MTDINAEAKLKEYHDKIVRGIPRQVHRWVVGADTFLESMIVCLLSGSRGRYNSNIFAEAMVGVGKTTIMEAFARACGGKYSWIQFTPDLLPQDLIRVVKELPDGTIEYQEGPLYANFVVADEINRSSEKTRAALLQAMEQGRVTIDNETRLLPKPFMVLATANPMDTEGVFRLGVAQSDRFMMQISMQEESEDEALEIINSHTKQEAEEIEPATYLETILEAREFIWDNVFLSEELKRYISKIVFRTRKLYNEEEKAYGASGKRPYIWLARGSKAFAFCRERLHVIQEDIDSLVPSVLAHRISLGGFGNVHSRSETGKWLQKMVEEMHGDEARREG